MDKARFLAFSCVHAPYTSEAGKSWLLNQIEDWKPTHVVCLGDLFDAEAASVHPGEAEHELADEYAYAATLLHDIRAIVPKAEHIWMHGNHDDNIIKSDPRRVPKALRSVVHWNENRIWGDEFRAWKQYPYIKAAKGIYTLGQVIFCHGFDAAGNSDELEGLQLNYLTGGHPWRLSVRGHTHRPVGVTQAKRSQRVLLPHYYANAGTIGFGDQQPEYMTRKDVSTWGTGVVVGEAKLGRVARMTAPEWEAELVRMI